MKLYFSPGACSLSPHIVARELGLDIQLEKVDARTKKTATGRDFWEMWDPLESTCRHASLSIL